MQKCYIAHELESHRIKPNTGSKGWRTVKLWQREERERRTPGRRVAGAAAEQMSVGTMARSWDKEELIIKEEERDARSVKEKKRG